MSQTDSTQTSGQKVKKSLINPLKEALTQNSKTYRFSLPNDNEIINVSLDLCSEISLVEAVMLVLKKISQEHPVDQNPQNYDVFVAKKNGQPKTDFPSYQIDIRLSDTGNHNFSLIHITFQERKPKRKSTYDLSNHYSPQKSLQQKDIQTLEKKNWFLRLLGCV